MSRRHSHRSYNTIPQAVLPPAPPPTPAVPTLNSLFKSFQSVFPAKAASPIPNSMPTSAPVASPLNSLLKSLQSVFPAKAASPKPFVLPALPVGDLVGGVSNTVRGLVLNDNWWLAMLILFLFFPNVTNKMFGGLFKD